MGETIKGKEVIAYKGMKSDMTCRDFKYELGKSYKTDKAKLCECGFHACLNPRDVLDYYPRYNSRCFKVKLSGEITKCGMWDTNIAATEITILEEISIKELLNIAEWWKNENVIDLLYFSDGFARVQRKDKWNFIDKQGNYLSDEWFNWADNFYDGFARVQRVDGLWNFINKDGKLLSNEWFEWVDNFSDGFARLKRSDGQYNFIDKEGKILSDEWFNLVDNFQEGFAVVQRVVDEKYNFIDANGKLLSDEWYKWVDDFNDGLAVVQRANGEWCNMDKTGKIIKN